MDRNGVYGLMGHVQRNRHVENLLGDAEYAQAADAVSSREADQLRKRKFENDRGKAHVMLARHLVQANLKPQEMDARLSSESAEGNTKKTNAFRVTGTRSVPGIIYVYGGHTSNSSSLLCSSQWEIHTSSIG